MEETDIIEQITQKEYTREFSNDLAKILYISLWFFFGLQNIFSTDASILNAQMFYTQFDFLCALYLFLSEKITLVHRDGFLRLPHEYRKKALYSNTVGILEGAFLLALLIIIWESISRAYLGSNESMILYQITRSIPTEELTFRGLGITLISGMLILAFKLNKDLDDQTYRNRYYAMWIITILFTGILFGLYHIPKYYDPLTYPYFIETFNGVVTLVPIWIPILYLSLLGILLGFITYRHGLVVAIIIHILNNLIASAMLGMLVLLL